MDREQAYRYWEERFDFSPKPRYCHPAAQFLGFVEEACASALEHNTLLAIQQTKVLLLDNFMARYQSAPKRHRVLESGNHQCLFSVLLKGYALLRKTELTLQPPILVDASLGATTRPGQSATPPTLEFDGIILGKHIRDKKE